MDSSRELFVYESSWSDQVQNPDCYFGRNNVLPWSEEQWTDVQGQHAYFCTYVMIMNVFSWFYMTLGCAICKRPGYFSYTLRLCNLKFYVLQIKYKARFSFINLV